jgi:hypothetical protein
MGEDWLDVPGEVDVSGTGRRWGRSLRGTDDGVDKQGEYQDSGLQSAVALREEPVAIHVVSSFPNLDHYRGGILTG